MKLYLKLCCIFSGPGKLFYQHTKQWQKELWRQGPWESVHLSVRPHGFFWWQSLHFQGRKLSVSSRLGNMSVGPHISQIQNQFLLVTCLCPLLKTGQMDVPSSLRDFDEKSLLILSSCSEQYSKDYLAAGSLFFSTPLIHFMPFLFAQQFITLVMVHCLSHRNDSAFSDKHLTCYKEQT